MTGYLQRIASSAIRPGGSVRPVAGTVFSASRYRAAREPAVVEQDILSARPRELDAPRGPIPRPAAREPARLPGAPRPPQEERPGNRPAPRAPLGIPVQETAAAQGRRRAPAQAQPKADRDSAAGPELAHSPESGLPARRAGEGGKPAPGEQRGGRPRDELTPPVEGRGPERPALAGSEAAPVQILRTESGPGEQAGERPFVPVVAGDFGPPAPFGASPAGPAEAARIAADRGRTRADGVPAAPREPDEISIHIGRIEVTAAQPPPLRPAAPKAHRKAPSLDEYLRRRGGRAP